MSARTEDHARLIITFFVKSRPSNTSSSVTAHSEDNFRFQSMACGPTFSQLLAPRVAPASLALDSYRTLATGIFQSVYTVGTPFPKPKKLRHHASITAFEALHTLEIIFDLVPNPPPTPLRPTKLAVFDMDSTLINEEVIDELARSIGITSAVSAITARAMNGEIEFEQSLRERLRLLKGVKADVWENLKKSISIAAGAKGLISYLRDQGIITVVVSGGFAPMALWLKEQLGLDHAYANHVRKPCFRFTTILISIITRSFWFLRPTLNIPILIFQATCLPSIQLSHRNINVMYCKVWPKRTRFPLGKPSL